MFSSQVNYAQSIDLDGAAIFLSASFPAPDRPERYRKNTDSHAITNTVLALINTVFASNGRLVFGGHPTIRQP